MEFQSREEIKFPSSMKSLFTISIELFIGVELVHRASAGVEVACVFYFRTL